MTTPVHEEIYGKRERRADSKRGRRDGKRRTPTYNDVLVMVAEEGSITAPYPKYLQSIALDEMAVQLADFVRHAKPRLENIESLRRQHANTSKDLERATEGIISAEAPLTEAELLPRSRVEAREDQALVLRSRRETSRARRIAAAHGGEAALHKTLGELDSQVAAAAAAIRADFVLAQTRAKQIGARCAMRVSAYWEHLVLAHAEGPYLAPMIRYTSQVLPSWVFEPATAEPEALGQGEYELCTVVERVRPLPAEPEAEPEPGAGPEDYEATA